MEVNGVGHPQAKVMFVAEAPGQSEESIGRPLVGASGDEFYKMLCDAQILPSSCRSLLRSGSFSLGDLAATEDYPIYLTNVARERPLGNKIEHFFLTKTEAKRKGIAEFMGRYPLPPIIQGIGKLKEEIARIQPNIIVAVGDVSLWALTGLEGITKWRGSTLDSRDTIRRSNGQPYTVVPILHPAFILRQWQWRHITVHDLRVRVLPLVDRTDYDYPPYRFKVRPSYEEACFLLDDLLSRLDNDVGETLPISVDCETRMRKYIACMAFATSRLDAFCIPFMCVEDPTGFWTEKEELHLVFLIKKILTHPNAVIIGQNFEYDRQYILRNWFFKSLLHHDTMTMHHTYQPEMRKALDLLSSLYCQFHRYWKDESKEWEVDMDEDRFWEYCCLDAVSTFECHEQLQRLLQKHGLYGQYRFQMDQHDAVFHMSDGIPMDMDTKRTFVNYLTDGIMTHRGYFHAVVGEKLNPKAKANWYDSYQQTGDLLYHRMGLNAPLDKDTKRPTTKSDYLPRVWNQEIILKPLLKRLENYRTLCQSRTVCEMRLDHGRITTALDINGTKTFRYAAKKNPFEEGTNGQNITSGEEE